MSVSDAVKKSADGVVIDLEVIPGSKTIHVPSGYNPWRKRIEVKLSEGAQKGKANRQLIKTLSDVLSVRESDIALIAGHTSHKKTLNIKGADVEQILDTLNHLLEKN